MAIYNGKKVLSVVQTESVMVDEASEVDYSGNVEGATNVKEALDLLANRKANEEEVEALNNNLGLMSASLTRENATNITGGIIPFKIDKGKTYKATLSNLTMEKGYATIHIKSSLGAWTFNLDATTTEAVFVALEDKEELYFEAYPNGDTSISLTLTISQISFNEKIEKNTANIETLNKELGKQERYIFERSNISSNDATYLYMYLIKGCRYRIEAEVVSTTNDWLITLDLPQYPSFIQGRYIYDFVFNGETDTSDNRLYVSFQPNSGVINNVKLTITNLSFNERLETLEAFKLPVSNILVLGDSFSAKGTDQWLDPMIKLFPKGSSYISLAVVSATVKDQSNDRTNYPYTSRPTSGTNTNTLACQIEKLKRLMAGTDLDEGEVAIYQRPEDYPNIIIIEGGQNDGKDSEEKVSNYPNQLVKKATNVYFKKRGSESEAMLGECYIRTPIEELDRTSFGGAYTYLYRTLHEMFPNAQIFITTCSSVSYRDTQVIDDRNNINDQQKNIASLLSIPIIDWFGETMINSVDNYASGSGTIEDPYILSAKSQDTIDGLHPNWLGGGKMALYTYKTILSKYVAPHRYHPPIWYE